MMTLLYRCGFVACCVVACGSEDVDGAGGGGSAGTPTGGNDVESGGGNGGGEQTGGAPTGGRNEGGFVPASCTDPNHELPPDAPALEPGVWTNISPQGVPFDSAATSLTQGMTIDPCNPATVYVCVRGAQSGLYRSTNGGSSWTMVSPESMCVNIRVDPEDPQHLYAANGVASGADGFWVSQDGGQSWAMPQGFVDAASAPGVGVFDVYHVEPDPADFDHVLVTFHYYWQGGDWEGALAGILETFDGGDTWLKHDPVTGWEGAGGYNVFFLYEPLLGIGDPNTWLYGTQGKGYWRTTDAGQNWSKVSEVDMQHGGGQIYYSQEGVLYVSGASAILRSTNNGESFEEIGPSGAFLSVTGDGETLYTGHHGGGKFWTAPESDDTNWTEYPGAPDLYEGPFQMAFDPHNRILYSANIRAGVYALKVP